MVYSVYIRKHFVVSMKSLGGNYMRNDLCWYCGGTLCWDNDFDASDYGYDSEGVVTQLHCTKCNASVEYVLTEEMYEERN